MEVLRKRFDRHPAPIRHLYVLSLRVRANRFQPWLARTRQLPLRYLCALSNFRTSTISFQVSLAALKIVFMEAPLLFP